MNSPTQLRQMPQSEDENICLNQETFLICQGNSINQTRSMKKQQKTISIQQTSGTKRTQFFKIERKSFRLFYDRNFSQTDENILLPIVKSNANPNQQCLKSINNRSLSVQQDNNNSNQIIHQRRISIQQCNIKNKIQIDAANQIRNNLKSPIYKKELNDSLLNILQKHKIPKTKFNLMNFVQREQNCLNNHLIL